MKVLHVTDTYLPRLGGIELHVRDLVEHQQASGLDVTVLTRSVPHVSSSDPPWVRRIPPAAGGPRHWGRSLEELACELRVDVVHVHASVVSPLAYLATRNACSRPTLVTVHSMWEGLGPVPRIGAAVLGLRRRPVVWSAVSARAAESVQQLVGSSQSVHVLPNAVDPRLWQSDGPTAAERPTPGTRTVVSVMRLTKVKRALALGRILSDVSARLPSTTTMRAVVIGDGPQRPALARFLEQRGLDDKVELVGSVCRADVRQRLAEASVFLAPAERESFGIAALEARSSGVPVVASSRSGVGDFIQHGVHGLLGNDDEELAAHVSALLTNDATRVGIAHHNRTVATRHDWEAALRRTSDLYGLALGRGGMVEAPPPCPRRMAA